MKTNELLEDAPVTTTNNAGAGLITPQLPIKPDNILKRYKKLLKSKDKSKVN